LSREELWEQAQELGIKVGRLELSMIKSRGREEKLAQEKEHYLAFITEAICEKASQGNLIYHGRGAHLLLPRVSHCLRVGLVVPQEVRLKEAMLELRVSRDKSLTYLEQIDEGFDKWVRYVHRVDPKEPGNYDFFVNLQNVSMENVSSALCAIADLPDFRPTPASRKLMEDLGLAARTRIRLAIDERTRSADLKVRAEGGAVTVTYMPRQEAVAEAIPEVLQDLKGCREIVCTMAETNILLVQETFDPESESFKRIVQLAPRWGAAVELLRVVAQREPGDEVSGALSAAHVQSTEERRPGNYTGGVEDDTPEPVGDDGGMARTLDELVALGRSGGGHTVQGGLGKILDAIHGDSNYAVVAVGDLFLSKEHSTRVRQTRELAMALRERLKAPVITTDELQLRFLFGKKQLANLLGFAALVASVYTLVFFFQAQILDFLGGEAHQKWKWLTSLGVGLFVPFIAYSYSKVTGSLLKLIGVD
jgi:hypothetical protein